jgi:hypothetical protein
VKCGRNIPTLLYVLQNKEVAILLNNTNKTVFVMEVWCILGEVGIEFRHIIYMDSRHQRINISKKGTGAYENSRIGSMSGLKKYLV